MDLFAFFFPSLRSNSVSSRHIKNKKHAHITVYVRLKTHIFLFSVPFFTLVHRWQTLNDVRVRRRVAIIIILSCAPSPRHSNAAAAGIDDVFPRRRHSTPEAAARDRFFFSPFSLPPRGRIAFLRCLQPHRRSNLSTNYCNPRLCDTFGDFGNTIIIIIR